MNVSDKARAAAMQFEAKKDALGQVQSGDWKLRFTVSPEDVPNGLLTAPMGTRYQVVIVELGDDEQPVAQKPENKHRLSQQAAMCCNEKRFWRFLEEVQDCQHVDGIAAVEFVRDFCAISSRSELDTNVEPAKAWRYLHGEYEAWKLL